MHKHQAFPLIPLLTRGTIVMDIQHKTLDDAAHHGHELGLLHGLVFQSPHIPGSAVSSNLHLSTKLGPPC